MLNQRQIEILLEFCNHPNEFLTASYLAKKMNVSLRTVQDDMRIIRKKLDEEDCAYLSSKASRGSCIVVSDYEEFSAFVNSLYQQHTSVSLSYSSGRSTKILLLLLSRHRAVSLYELEERFYVSRSTLLNDLKKVEEILGDYQLELLRGSNKVIIDGFEINKRRCLLSQDLYLTKFENEQSVYYVDEQQFTKIKNILTEVFVEKHYHIMDTDFRNTILFLNIMICRMSDGFYIQPNELNITEDVQREYDVSKAIFEKVSRKFLVKVIDKEIEHLAVYLGSQGNNQDVDTISPEMDEFVAGALKNIKDHFGMDLQDNINLRLTLALHCNSLKIRIKYDMQIKNEMLEYIRESFPLGYSVAAYFSYLLQRKYGKKVREDEIALLAIHFYSGLLEIYHRAGKSNILIISSIQNSKTLLLKQTLLKWFAADASAIDFVDPAEVTGDLLDDYQVYLTTEKEEFFEKGLAMFVNPFPNQRDYTNIKLNLDGFKNINDVLDIFHPALFQCVNRTTKENALHEVSVRAEQIYEIENLEEGVLQREEIGSTYFSKYIAVPHMLSTVSSDTFVSVLVSRQTISWDEENNEVHLVMLLHVGKNNPRAFKLWEYFSKLFADKMLIEKLMKNPVYDNFIELIREALETGIYKKD